MRWGWSRLQKGMVKLPLKFHRQTGHVAARTFLQVDVWIKGTSPFGDKLRFTTSQMAARGANTIVTVYSAFRFGCACAPTAEQGATRSKAYPGMSGPPSAPWARAQGRVYVFPVESNTRLVFFPSMSLILTFHGKSCVQKR